MSVGQILYAVKDSQCIIKLTGEIKYTISSGLDEVIKYATRLPEIKSFVIDLTEASYLDSTNLGLLAIIAQWSRKNKYQPSTIFSNNADVNSTLENMGFGKIFNLIQDYPLHFEGLNPAEIKEENERQKAERILDAHKALMEINERNQKMFKSAVDLLSRDLGMIQD